MAIQPTLVAERVRPIAGSRQGPGTLTPLRGFVNRYFYFGMSLLIAAIVVFGFSHTINANLLHPSVPRPLILWFHAAAFSTWVAFFIFQSALVRTHNVKWHRFFGWFGAGLGTTMVLLGMTTAIVMDRFEAHTLHESGTYAFFIVQFYDLVAFAVLFTLAVAWRKKPEMHRRLILIATCGLLSAAFGRLNFVGEHSLFYACLDLVILLGVARDLFVNRRIHKVYVVALPVLMVCQGFVVYTLLSNAAWWLRIAHAVLG